MAPDPQSSASDGPAANPDHGFRFGTGGMATRILAGTMMIGAIVFVMFSPQSLEDLRTRVEDITGTGPRGGLLFIEPPQVYTRERLVNDRFDQANWLTRELDSTSRENAEIKAATAARAIEQVNRLRIEMGSGSARRPDGETAPDSERASAAAPQPPVQLEQMEVFRRRMEYRNHVRTELMDTLLDDGHDLDGNTLYRFNFDAVVMPWADVHRYPGTAAFIITASAPPRLEEKQKLIEVRDNLELLQSWKREIQIFLTRAVKFRAGAFDEVIYTEADGDPKEDIVFETFLRKTLLLAYVDIFRANILAYCKGRPNDSPRNCPLQWLTPESETAQRDIVLGWLGLKPVSTLNDNIELPPRMELGFRKTLLLAHEVNNRQWPRLGEGSYSPECMRRLETKTPNAEDIQKRFDRECLLPYNDKGYKRALIRLIIVFESMEKHLEASEKVIFNFNPETLVSKDNSPPDWFTKARRAFVEVLPDQADLEAVSREIAALSRSNTELPSIHRLENTCQSDPRFKFSLEKITKEKLLSYGKCLFLRAHGGKVENIIARFIRERVSNLQPVLGGQMLTDFVEVKPVGCDVTDCRIEVRSKPPSNLDCKGPADSLCYMDGETCDQAIREGYIPTGRDSEQVIRSECRTAASLRHWLDETRKSITVYEVQPHVMGTLVRRDESTDQSGQIGAATVMMGGQVDRSNRLRSAEFGVTPRVIGFGHVNQSGLPHADREQPVFGWVVRPERGPEQGWMPGHHRLSVILSVPSWWKRLHFSIRACWTTPETARALGFRIVNVPRTICDDQIKTDSVLKREYTVQLPRRTEDVTERFRFDFIKAPYLDPQWARKPQLDLEAGRPGRLVILGERLWRGTVVTVDGQPANKITVLPDMKGVIAEFDCVMSPPPDQKRAPASKAIPSAPQPTKTGKPTSPAAVRPPPEPPAHSPQSSEKQLRVWTSEGRTQAIGVKIHPFNAIRDEKPCPLPVPTRAEKEEKDKPAAAPAMLWIGTQPAAPPK